MISVEGWLFISMVATLFFWGVIIGIRGMLGRPDQPDSKPMHAHKTDLMDERLEEWGRDLWRA